MWLKIWGVLQREGIIKPQGVLLLLFIITAIIERLISFPDVWQASVAIFEDTGPCYLCMYLLIYLARPINSEELVNEDVPSPCFRRVTTLKYQIYIQYYLKKITHLQECLQLIFQMRKSAFLPTPPSLPLSLSFVFQYQM